MFDLFLTAVWLMLPAYVPNSAAVLTGGGPPIDGGRMFRGNRLLGDGKTWAGTLGGLIAGTGVALILNLLLPHVEAMTGVTLFSFPLVVVLALPAGALIGDMAASFIKRRSGRERGAPAPGLDQLDFVAGSLVLTGLLAPSWIIETVSIEVIVFILVLTPVLHVGVNIVGYRAGLKDEPW